MSIRRFFDRHRGKLPLASLLLGGAAAVAILGFVEREVFPQAWYDANKDGVKDALVLEQAVHYGNAGLGYIDGREIREEGGMFFTKAYSERIPCVEIVRRPEMRFVVGELDGKEGIDVMITSKNGHEEYQLISGVFK